MQVSITQLILRISPPAEYEFRIYPYFIYMYPATVPMGNCARPVILKLWTLHAVNECLWLHDTMHFYIKRTDTHTSQRTYGKGGQTTQRLIAKGDAIRHPSSPEPRYRAKRPARPCRRRRLVHTPPSARMHGSSSWMPRVFTVGACYGTRIAVKMDSTQTGQVHAFMISGENDSIGCFVSVDLRIYRAFFHTKV